MKKCKICGKVFQYHIPNSHLEEHDITRKEYNEIKQNDNLFFLPKSKFNESEDMIRNYIINSVIKNTRKDKKLYSMNKEIS